MLERRPRDYGPSLPVERLSHPIAPHREPHGRALRPVVLDRALELLPLFRLSDSTDESAVTYTPPPPSPRGSRWRVLPSPEDRVPGTFDQDVYVELLHRYHDAGSPADGTISFTLHAFLRSMGRRVDGRTYEQLRSALARLERSILESTEAYFAATPTDPRSPPAVRTGRYLDDRFTLLTAVSIDRRRAAERDQLALFATLSTHEPGEARVTLSPVLRANISAGYTTMLSAARYFELPSPTARRLYRLIAAVQAEAAGAHVYTDGSIEAGSDHEPRISGTASVVADNGARVRETESEGEGTGGLPRPRARRPEAQFVWNVALDALAEQLPLSQRYPSHLQRVLEPAHAMLKAAGLVCDATIRQQRRSWVVHYELP